MRRHRDHCDVIVMHMKNIGVLWTCFRLIKMINKRHPMYFYQMFLISALIQW